jgi:hypothetical protein
VIRPDTADEIRRLLAEGKLSHRAIARKFGVSRGTVTTLAAAPQPDYEWLRRRREAEQAPIVFGPVSRCPMCGAKVHMPCRECAIQRLPPVAPCDADDPRPPEPLAVTLRGNARARYEAVHLARMEQGELTDEELEAEPGLKSRISNLKSFDPGA